MASKEPHMKKGEIAIREEEILTFWEENKIFDKSEDKAAPNGDFVFYDGPPFATGLPHYGHIVPNTIKDIIPRFKTMQGYRVRRKWGWDCHGLPLENIVEKKLGLKTKKDIEEVGIATFNETARNSVLEYADDWKRIIPRLGRWAHMNEDYKTMDPRYTESVWWVFSELYKKELINEGFKAMHLCPRCGTTLSNFEVAQGYKDIKDFSVIVKLELVDEKNTFLLAWTTTPWTLPGNMAAAVHKDETYISVENEDGETFILGKERLEEVFKDKPHQIVKEFKGKELVGKSYKPPFNYYKNKEFNNKEYAWKVWHADYVSQEDGTGLVHIAPAFGGDDLLLSQEHNIPVIHHVGQDGTFVDDITDFKGLSVKPKDNKEQKIDHTDTDVEIIKWLAHNGLLFAKQKIEHSYPHCWRCDTPLLNYAASSWFMTAPKIKDSLLRENQNVGWVPNDIKDGRMGKWLEGVRDWAISRSRYWGAPIPVWKNERTNEHVVIGSIDDLLIHTKQSGNTYHIMRHGESELNTQGILNADIATKNGITEKGRKQVQESAKKLASKKIDLIFHSPLQRTTETAGIIKDTLGLSGDALMVDERLREVGFGEFEGAEIEGWRSFFDYSRDINAQAPKGGESWVDLKKRMSEFLYEIEEKYQDKNILIISHGSPLEMLQAGAYGYEDELCKKCLGHDTLDLKNAEVREIPFIPLPHNEEYKLDVHRPYIDEVELVQGKDKLVRVEDVFDCWFESGSMPYGQHHYKGTAKEGFDPEKGLGFPADFIAEGLDQTRGWFYSLIVLGTALFDKSPYKNVVVNGFVLAEDGKKMSKKLQNYPDLMEVVNKYGVDSLRYYLMSSPVVRGEDLNFSEKGVQEVMRKNIGRLSNVVSFYDLYKNDIEHDGNTKSEHVLDKWIIARLNETHNHITKGLEQYELDRATRPIGLFIDDLSTWYLRRSRDRFKGEDEQDKKAALSTIKHVLQETSKIIAPTMPFFADYLYKKITNNKEKESVHLEDWPKENDVEETLLSEMQNVRDLITLGLEKRDKEGFKVRQPLNAMTIPETASKEKESFFEIIKDELNIKNVTEDKGLESDVVLDIKLTPELITEGNYRDLLRKTQELRKNEKLNPSDQVIFKVQTNEDGKALIETWKEHYMKTAGISEIIFVENTDGLEVVTGDMTFFLSIEK